MKKSTQNTSVTCSRVKIGNMIDAPTSVPFLRKSKPSLSAGGNCYSAAHLVVCSVFTLNECMHP